jgi:hypothetical protein
LHQNQEKENYILHQLRIRHEIKIEKRQEFATATISSKQQGKQRLGTGYCGCTDMQLPDDLGLEKERRKCSKKFVFTRSHGNINLEEVVKFTTFKSLQTFWKKRYVQKLILMSNTILYLSVSELTQSTNTLMVRPHFTACLN